MVLLPPAVNLRPHNQTFSLTVQVWDAPPTTLQLDFSLQRHHYLHTAQSHSEQINSLFHADVTSDTIRGEVLEVGQMLKDRAAQTQQQATNFAYAAAYAAQRVASREGRIVEPPAGANNRVPGLWQPPTALWDDFRVRSSRVYRVDATSQQARTSQVNHLFVISGPKVWGQMKREDWSMAQAVRRVEIEMERARVRVDALDSKLNSMRADPRLKPTDNELFRYLVAAQTTFRSQRPKLDQLKQVSGNEALVIALARFAAARA